MRLERPLSLGVAGDTIAVEVLSREVIGLASRVGSIESSARRALEDLTDAGLEIEDKKRLEATLGQILQRASVAIRFGQEPIEALRDSLRFTGQFRSATLEPASPGDVGSIETSDRS